MNKNKTNKDSSKTKKNTSLRLDSKTLKKLKRCALEEDTSVQALLEKLIEDYLDSWKPPEVER